MLNGDEFLAQLLETFRGEAEEHLSAIATGLLILEQSGTPPDVYQKTVEQVFRETHSLKGAARAVGLRDIETLCQHQENVFSGVKKGTLTLSPESFDLFHSVLQILERLLANEKEVKTGDLIQKLRALASGGPFPKGMPPSTPEQVPSIQEKRSEVFIQPTPEIRNKPDDDNNPKNLATEPSSEAITTPYTPSDADAPVVSTSPIEPSFPIQNNTDQGTEVSPPLPLKGGTMIKISSDRLENLFGKADDLMGARLAAGQRSTSLRELLQSFLSWKWAWSQVTTDIEHLRTEYNQNCVGISSALPAEIERVTGFLEYNRAFIRTLESDITTIARAANRDQYLLDTATTELIDEIKQVILVPASSILDNYPRAARDLARDTGKDVDVLISGADIEIDRRILEGIRDPILHIIRNCIDHGIEFPSVRHAKGKNERGQIRISVIHGSGHQAEIRIADDGGGIDTNAVRTSAIAKGLITAEEISRMGTEQINRLIFKSGLSTSKTISTVSGRGLGLAIVLEKVEQIGGIVRVTSSSTGTEFILSLPLSLATFRGIKVYASRHPFFLPLRSIDRVMQINHEEIKTIENRTIIEIGNDPVAVVSLAKVLGLSVDNGNGDEPKQLIVSSASGIRFGLLVDRISGTEEIVVKDLGQQLRKVPHISGASILGDGVVVPVINCEDLAATISRMEHMAAPGQVYSDKTEQRSILVTEDSITSRMLLKNILEGAGYLVETAVDGVDALMKLKLKPVDVVVSDVDMPRMNGFVLTEKIRADPTISNIPIILVTSLDSREDREHGIMVGANAYIVKSSFDQGNLLEVISRHI
ncbi:MAG TPA: hybrid sensor histidine kinase/response regulator [Methanospirillum sp.]|nr:hybrid sensor histidine kinase/response regulator [Methanospirillum sp.]